MSTNFERLFPLLSLESCLSFATGSRNGPRFEAVDRTSQLPYEVRVIRLYKRSGSSSLIPTAVSSEGSAPSPQQQQLRDATTQRAAALLSAASQVRGGSEQTVSSGTSGREAFPFLFPEDVYIAQEEEWDRNPPSSSPLSSTSPTLASSSEGRITSDHRSRMLRAVPRCHAVMVFRKCGPSLYDLLKQVQDESLRNHAGLSHATGTMASPVFITERSFQCLCQLVSCYAKTHLAFPVHGNLSLNSFVLRSTKRDEEEWWLTDWSGEDCQFSSDEQKVDSLNVDEKRSFGQTKKVHVKLLRILQSAFAPPLQVHQSTSENRISEPQHRTNQKFLRVVGSSSSTPLSLEAVECQIVEAVCGHVHNNPTTTKISNRPLGVSSEGDPLPLIEGQLAVQMAGEVEINESSTSAARGGPSSSSVASPTPISDEESKQLSLLAVERVEASVEARTHFTQQDEPERKNDIGPSSTSGNELERIAGRDEIPFLSADVLRQLLICRQRFLRRISDPVTIAAADSSLTHDGGSTSPSPPTLVEPHWYYDPYVPPFHASADYQSLRSSRTCIAAQDPRPDMGSSSRGNHHHSDSCRSISGNKQDSSKTSNNDHKSCCAVM